MRLMPTAGFFLAVALLTGTAAAQSQLNNVSPGKHSEFSPTPSTAVPDFSQEPYLYESVRGTLRYENDGTGVREIKARLHVQTPAGLDKVGQLVFEYNAANERIDTLSVRVIKPDGSIITAGPDAVQDLSAPVAHEAPMYTDARQKHVTVPGLAVGDKVEYDIVTSTFKPLMQGQFWQTWNFVGDAICLDEQLDLNVPRGRSLKMKSPDGVEPSVHDEGDRRIYHWATSNLSYVVPNNQLKNFKFAVSTLLEGYQPPLPRQASFSTFQSWSEVGDWYAQLEDAQMAVTPAIHAQADEIAKGMTTDAAKAQALYEWVSRNIRYVSLSFGIGRYQPHAASEVLANRYGDCKDKATLLDALLDAEGIHGQEVLINSRAGTEPGIPSPLEFDHAINFVRIDNRDIWLDSTMGVAPFGYLLPQLRGKNALVVFTDTAPALRRTPEALLIPTFYSLDIQGSVDADGKIDAKIGFDTRGDLEVLMRAGLLALPPGKMDAVLQAAAAQAKMHSDNDITLSDFKAGDPTDTSKPFHIEIRVAGKSSKTNFKDESLQDAVQEFTSGLLSHDEMLALLPGAEGKSDSSGETGLQSVKLGGPKEYSARIAVTSSAAKILGSKEPIHVKIATDLAEYESTIVMDGQTIRAELRLNLRVPEVPASRSKEYAEFCQKVIESLGTPTSPSSAAAKSSSEQSLYDAGLKEYDNRNYDSAAELLESLVAQDPKLKGAWNDLGRTYAALGLQDKAIAAYHKAIELDPSDPYAYNNLGNVLFMQKNYEDAAKAFEKQIAINPDDQYAHANLGRLYLEKEQYEKAVPELERASELTPENSKVQGALGTAYFNLGKSDQAVAAYDRAAELSPIPSTWNQLSYYMADKNFQLDRAQHYAELAISGIAAQMADTSLDHLSMRDVTFVCTLSSYWDTMGWVKFRQGNFPQAEKYISSAWELCDFSTVGDHLGQVYEKEGRKPDAIRVYELALATDDPLPETRARLASLIGGDSKVDESVSSQRAELANRRAIRLKNTGNLDGMADFWVLLASGPNVVGVRFISGDESLRGYSQQISAAHFPDAFPDATALKVVRRGQMSCSHTESDCTFLVVSGESIHSIH
jgi:tetratricopeptide (TPR) repeat protein